MACLVLLALALRALIPVGFEPADDGSLSLTICDEGFPAYLLSHGPLTADDQRIAHPRGAPHHERCLFCDSSTFPAPAPLLAVAASAVFVEIGAAIPAAPHTATVHLVHLPQARAPPAFA